MEKQSQLILPIVADGEDKSSPLQNRLRKNYRHLRKWAKRSNTDCFRLYDRDIKEYPVIIDFYAGRFCVQGYTDDRDNDEPRQDLVDEVGKSLAALFNATNESIFWRMRTRRRKTEQYEKKSDEKLFFEATEHGLKFYVNLGDYLDTGLFLDHRETRQRVALIASGKRVLNLFAYTCSFSVHAAAAGALETTSVDLSNTYLAWGKKNFLLNNLSLENHQFVRADCLRFLDEALDSKVAYDVIVIDPPTLSRSKKLPQMFDIQKEHTQMLSKALHLLAKGGVIYFSTNYRKFDFEPPENSIVQELTPKSIPIDFRNQRIHRCWTILRPPES